MELNRRTMEEEFNNLMMRFRPVYHSEPGYQMGIKYIKGLLGQSIRKNGWQLAEYLGFTQKASDLRFPDI